MTRTNELQTVEAERLHLFISGITDYAIYMLTPEGNVASWNAGAQRFKGYLPHEIIGEHFSRFYTEEDRRAGVPAKALQTALTAGKFEAEGWRVRKDGSRFWASVVIDPIRTADGTLVGFAKITRDTTDKRRAEQELRESEQRFRMLVQGVTDYAIYMLSPEGNITNWNAGGRRIKGYEASEVLGSHFRRFYTPEERDAGAPEAALHRAANDGRYEAEGWRVRKDGTRFWAHVVIDAIRSDSGELVGYAKITRDVTERKNATAALEQAKEALFQSQKLEAIGKLTGGVAHDFNNLMNVVSNGLSILRRRQRDPADVKLLDTMDSAISRGAALTQQLLSFARQQPFNKETRDVNRVVASFEAVLRRAGRSGSGFELDLAEDLPSVTIDVGQFEIGLLNLVVNAFDAMDNGGKVVIATRAVALDEGKVKALPAGQYIGVTVTDTGHGMSPEVITKAIEPFFTTKELGQGTGLGLSQVYGMVQQSGGDLEIVSAVGEGTSITMYFPVTDARPDDEPNRGQQDMETVLVVDDQPEVLDMTAELFKTLGFEVLSANSGKDAMEILSRTPGVNLMFSDVIMPGMTGLELARKARGMFPAMKIILASGFAGNARNAQTGGALDGFPFLPKPYRVNDLVKKLREIG